MLRQIDTVLVCEDCLFAIEYGEYGGLGDVDVTAITFGIERLGEGGRVLSALCPDECDTHFSWTPCECCRRPEGGNRHVVAVMGRPTFTRICGPEQTYECGDVEYEVGSTYKSDLGDYVSVNYMVTDACDGSFAVEYRVASWVEGDEDNPLISYDYAEAIGFDDINRAIAAADAHAAVDESALFS